MFERSIKLAVWACSVSGGVLVGSGCSTGRTYATPQEAMRAVADVCGQHDEKQVDEIFGPGATQVLWSGDDVADRADGLRVREMILQRVHVVPTEDGESVAYVGNDDWPFPIPLEQTGDGWRFDLSAGREELQDRRIGRNELLTIETLRAYVDAQREYASTRRDGKPPAYAQKFWSQDGLQDGLYWPTAEGEPESPLGPLVAEATAGGYDKSEDGPRPFHGYYYRILTAQGPNAPGGARSYVDARGNMTGGFAAVAWPAIYGNSGIMTFVVNEVGVIFQKDLGPGTGKEAASITQYNPDESWEPTSDSP